MAEERVWAFGVSLWATTRGTSGSLGRCLGVFRAPSPRSKAKYERRRGAINSIHWRYTSVRRRYYETGIYVLSAHEENATGRNHLRNQILTTE